MHFLQKMFFSIWKPLKVKATILSKFDMFWPNMKLYFTSFKPHIDIFDFVFQALNF